MLSPDFVFCIMPSSESIPSPGLQVSDRYHRKITVTVTSPPPPLGPGSESLQSPDEARRGPATTILALTDHLARPHRDSPTKTGGEMGG